MMKLSECACADGAMRADQFETKEVGCDDTEGRYADVTLNRCLVCGRLWVRYFVEYEAFSLSARWARGLIDAEAAKVITPQTTLPHLYGLEWYLYGGSYFSGKSARWSGPMYWGL